MFVWLGTIRTYNVVVYSRKMVILWTVLGIAVATLFMKYLIQKKYKLPPGPPRLPFIGNVFHPDKERPHITLTEWSEKYGDIFLFKVSVGQC